MKREKSVRSKKLYQHARVAVISILILVLLANVWVLFSKQVLNDQLPGVFGWKTAVIMTDSMEPVFKSGDLLIYHKQPAYAMDDIVIYQSDDTFVTHRIVGIEDECLITKGDANTAQDSKSVSLEQVEGKMVVVLPNIGNYLRYATTLLVFFVIVLMGYIVFEIPQQSRRRKYNKRIDKESKKRGRG